MNKFGTIMNYLDLKRNFKNIYVDFKTNQGPFIEMINVYVTPASAVTTVEGLQSFMDNLFPSELKPILKDDVHEELGQIVGRLYFDEVISVDYLIEHNMITTEELVNNALKVELLIGKEPERRVLVTVLPNIEKAIDDLIKGVAYNRDFLRRVQE